MKALIIGGAGFAGRYLIDELLSRGYEVTATKMPFEKKYPDCEFADLDLSGKEEICRLLKELRPDRIFNLAAVSSVKDSWNNVRAVFDANVSGVINLLDAVKENLPEARLLLCGSGEEYGFDINTKMPVTEDSPANPGNPYAISKLTQTLLGKMYARSFGLHVIMMRAFNHIGRYQRTGFVVTDFCKQIAEIEKGLKPPVIYTGNLEAMRDFTDVRDIVKGYASVIEKGEKGNIYNIGSGKCHKIEFILKTLLSMSRKGIEVKPDEAKYRPTDVPVIYADITKLQNSTGWRPEITIEESLKDILNYFREIE